MNTADALVGKALKKDGRNPIMYRSMLMYADDLAPYYIPR